MRGVSVRQRVRTDLKKTYQWQRARAVFLQRNPLCMMCQQQGRIARADVVDHVIPHKGDEVLFWDVSNWQGLCTAHHSSTKQRIEKSGKAQPIGADGWPILE